MGTDNADRNIVLVRRSRHVNGAAKPPERACFAQSPLAELTLTELDFTMDHDPPTQPHTDWTTQWVPLRPIAGDPRAH
jgi:hypothetical protein